MTLLLVSVGLALLLLTEIVFFVFAYRWLTTSKRQREKDFQLLDKERLELMKIQGDLLNDMQTAKKFSQETLEKIAAFGTATHAEWDEMTSKIAECTKEIDIQSKNIVATNLEELQKQSMVLEKILIESRHKEAALKDRIERAETVLRFFDKNVPSEEIMKDIQTERYEQARKMLEKGIEPTFIAKRLGMSLSEVSLLSFVR